MRRFSVYLVALAIGMSVPVQNAFAQGSSMPIIQIAPDFAMSNLNRELLERRDAQDGVDSALVPDAQSTPPADPTAFRFKSDRRRQKLNLQNLVERSRTVDPDGAARLEAIFASTDIMSLIGQSIAPLGFSTEDLADAYTVWWVSVYQASLGSTATPSHVSYRAVRRQSERVLLSSQFLIDATDAQKQELAEAYFIQAALTDSAVEEAQADPAYLEALKASVVSGAMASGLDLDSMVLTEEGFRSP